MSLSKYGLVQHKILIPPYLTFDLNISKPRVSNTYLNRAYQKAKLLDVIVTVPYGIKHLQKLKYADFRRSEFWSTIPFYLWLE